jgi:exodeoxyribonuclease V alpha subunit
VEEQPETLKGTLSKIRFESDDGNFAIGELDVRGRKRPVTLVGNLLSTQPGETVEVEGQWEIDPTYGRQFEVDAIRSKPPTSREGIERYLASGLVEGIGDVLAERIVDHFGEETLEILDDDPNRIREVEGIGDVRGERIADAWKQQRAIRSLMVFLQSHGVSSNRAVKIWKQYGSRARRILKRNPYRLAEDVHGIGFKTADEIARELGIEPDADERLRAGLLYELEQADGDGHMYLPLPELEEQAAERLEVPEEMLDGPLDGLRSDGAIVVEPGDAPSDPPAVYRRAAHDAEREAARHLAAIVGRTSRLDGTATDAALEDAIDRAESEIGIELADAQREAVAAAGHEDVVVITGGPGTGKTTIVRAICEVGDQLGVRIALSAPTGRAAKRLGESTGRGAQTVHRLLEYSVEEGGFQRDADHPLDVDALVVDEASMLDTFLFRAVVRALPPGSSLILVGDIDQLPSVGPGDVLAELIDSEVARVVELTEIFRQHETSGIVLNAHRINRGEMPVGPDREEDALSDFYTISAENPVAARSLIVDAVTERIPEAFDFDPIRDVQILSPMHRGDVGCRELNDRLQDRFHADARELERGGRTWKVGDRVMQTRNNYDLDVFNGDIGTLREIDDFDDTVTVRFDGRDVEYPFSHLSELELAYAITVHKSQGSEYPAVVIPVVKQHYIMLQRNLLYTAVTRARELVLLIGSSEAVWIAVDNDTAQTRYTRLGRRIRQSSSR